MQPTSLLYVLFLLPSLAQGNPIAYSQPLSPNKEEYNDFSTSGQLESIIARTPGQPISEIESLNKHWRNNKGGAKDGPGFIDVMKREKGYGNRPPEFLIKGKWYPLIELDCTNAYPTKTYKGNYYDICRNFLWIRYVL